MQVAEGQAAARYVMIGGFLGAGKTTSILRFAEWLTERGLKVGLVTNDQGGSLVDTALAAARKLPVEEIVGGCFCCRFNSLVEAADALVDAAAPDVLIAEPVGSCTDLVATVSLPLEQIYGDRFAVAPVSVVVDPLRAERVLGLAEASLSEHVCYIYRKQLEEAEIIVINKADLVDSDRLNRLKNALAEVAPAATLQICSARDNTGLEPWFEAMLTGRSQAAAIADIDYDEYAYGESLLGWLNAEVVIGSADSDEYDGTALLVDLMQRIRQSLDELGHEIAHMKATLSVEGDPYELAAANLVRTADVPAVSHRLAEPVDIGRTLINLRAEASPEALKAAVEMSLDALRVDRPCEIIHLEHFRPGKPVPTHRIAARS
ncbi:MAG: GTP-binding protein [Pirellulales bacterium]|jgi:Ni2+-binding GTPase involved in maturation of urease and hydrogenase